MCWEVVRLGQARALAACFLGLMVPTRMCVAQWLGQGLRVQKSSQFTVPAVPLTFTVTVTCEPPNPGQAGRAKPKYQDVLLTVCSGASEEGEKCLHLKVYPFVLLTVSFCLSRFLILENQS